MPPAAQMIRRFSLCPRGLAAVVVATACSRQQPTAALQDASEFTASQAAAARAAQVELHGNSMLLNLLHTVADSEAELPARIRALDDLAKSADTSTIIELESLLDRTRTEPSPVPINWDPVAAERVVDLHIVEVLFLLGNDTQLDRLPLLIKAAGHVLTGADGELENAAAVVRRIGRVELVRHLVVMTEDDALQMVRNAVVVLNQLELPLPAAGGALTQVFQQHDTKVTFEVSTLKQELEKMAALSDGKVVLSAGSKSFLWSNDFPRGLVRREEVSLAELVQRFIPRLDFDYYVVGRTVVICTHAEAGQRWRDWWGRNAKRLAYQKENGRFVLL
jgi:hypothetical protein